MILFNGPVEFFFSKADQLKRELVGNYNRSRITLRKASPITENGTLHMIKVSRGKNKIGSHGLGSNEFI